MYSTKLRVKKKTDFSVPPTHRSVHAGVRVLVRHTGVLPVLQPQHTTQCQVSWAGMLFVGLLSGTSFLKNTSSNYILVLFFDG